MTDDQQISELLRAANPVPHHRDAMRVVRETDPLWQTIQTRLAGGRLDAETIDQIIELHRRPQEGIDMETTTSTRDRRQPRRDRRTPRLAVAAGIAAGVVLLAVLTVVRPGGDAAADYAGAAQVDALPPYLIQPEAIADVVDVTYSSASTSQGPGLAPVDCTALGVDDPVETQQYRAVAGEQGFVGSSVFRQSDAAAASQLIDAVHQDVQDCDEAAHGLFRAQLEAITEVDVADRAFVMSVHRDGERECWIWAQQDDLVAVTLLALQPGPSLDQCTDVARGTGEALARR